MKKNKIIQLVIVTIVVLTYACGNIEKKSDEQNTQIKVKEPKIEEVVEKEIFYEEEVPELTRQEDVSIPPPPEEVVEILNIVDDSEDIDMEYVYDIECDEKISLETDVVEEQEVFGFKKLEAEKKVSETPINHNTEEYNQLVENEFKDAKQNPLSTFSIDVDNASYSNVRRYLKWNQLPPKGAVRIEEMINYFDYEYPDAKGEHPFNFITEISNCPWAKENKIIHIGIQGKKLDYDELKPSNLVFLLDVSGSMDSPNKLPLLKKSFALLLDQLDDKDKISIVVYAGAAGLVLPPTSASEKDKIKEALNNLSAGGSTAGGAGINLAYEQAKNAFIKDGNNRVILATDGDFNIGTSSTSSLVELIEQKRKDDIYLTILGLGMGNYKDGRMEEISNAGNGNYFYIDNIKEAEKVFVKEMRANMFTIAKDVKIQIEFNPAHVKSYRLIGYENRILNKEDFNDDKKDAGELGAGHTVTAIYEIVPTNSETATRKTDELKYQETKMKKEALANNELMTLKFRYKPPKSDKSTLIVHPVVDKNLSFEKTSDNFRFSLAVAGFGMLLRDSKFKGTANYTMIEALAKKSQGKDKNGYRAELISLINTAKLLSSNL